jgi:hypothetical protein
MNNWSKDYEDILENIRHNSIIMSNYHKKRFYHYKGLLKYFRIPLIVISALNSVFSVGLQPFLEQGTISVICCLLSLFSAIISSLELFLAISSQMESELNNSKLFYLLGVDIYKTLSLSAEHRPLSGKDYLDRQYSEYCKLIENSNLIDKKIMDKLAVVKGDITTPLSTPRRQESLMISTADDNSDNSINV